MPRQRTADKLCGDIRMCLSNEMHDIIEKYQAEIRLKKGLKLRKSEAAEKLFEKMAVDQGLLV